MSDHDKKKAVYDRMHEDHKRALVDAGVPYREAERSATKLMNEAAERLDRRERDR